VIVVYACHDVTKLHFDEIMMMSGLYQLYINRLTRLIGFLHNHFTETAVGGCKSDTFYIYNYYSWIKVH